MSSVGEFDLTHVCFEGRTRVRPGAARAAASRGASASGARPAPTNAAAEGFPARVLGRAGLDAASYRALPLRRRVAACLRALKCRDEAEALALLERRPERLDVALSALLIGVTDPFRDDEVFEAIRSRVLPHFAAKPGPLRVWSAGCANGAELLSVAALLAEAGLLERSRLLGTDCRAEATAEAAAGVLRRPRWPARFAALRDRYFEPLAGGAWRPAAALGRRAAWKLGDVAVAAEEGPWELVLWRNVSIYLTAAAAARVAAAIVDQLAPGGWLVVGKAERLQAERLGLLPIGRCLYRKPGVRGE